MAARLPAPAAAAAAGGGAAAGPGGAPEEAEGPAAAAAAAAELEAALGAWRLGLRRESLDDSSTVEASLVNEGLFDDELSEPSPCLARRSVLVAGGDSGIGPALCRQLASRHACRVFLGARDGLRGQAVLAAMLAEEPACAGRVQVVRLDPRSTASVLAAARAVRRALGAGAALGALVSNAEPPQTRGLTAQVLVSRSLYLCEAFIPLLDPVEGRVVTVGTSVRPAFSRSCDSDRKQILTSSETTWEEVESLVEAELASDPLTANSSYGISKACLKVYSEILARAHPKIRVSMAPHEAFENTFASNAGTEPDMSVIIHGCLP